jgi:hypothetical protein
MTSASVRPISSGRNSQRSITAKLRAMRSGGKPQLFGSAKTDSKLDGETTNDRAMAKHHH